MATKHRSDSEVRALKERAKRAMRPHLSPTERVAEHARHQRDYFANRASDTLSAAERENRRLSGSELHEIDKALAERDQWVRRYEDFQGQAKAQRERISVRREPLVYERNGPRSYFADSWRAQREGDAEAVKRLERHVVEMRYELPRLETRRAREQESATSELGVEYRTTPVPTSSNFAPPLWLVEDLATAPRPERVVSRLVTNLDLPAGVQSVNIPRLKTGTVAQTNTSASAVAAQDLEDAAVSGQVCLIVGEQDIALQLLEQSGAGLKHVDVLIWKDLLNAADATLEEQVIDGGGLTKELQGIVGLTGKGTVTYTSGSPTGQAIFKPLGETMGLTANNRKLPPTCFVCRSGFWAWLGTSEDEQKRPFGLPLDFTSSTTSQPIGLTLGLPTYLSEGIPVNLSGNQQVVICARPEDSYLFTSAPHLSLYEDITSGTLEARLQLRFYCALLHRYPASYTTLGGTGLAQQTNF